MTFSLNSVTFNSPGNYLVSVDEDGSIRVWNDQEDAAVGASEVFTRLNAHRDEMLEPK